MRLPVSIHTYYLVYEGVVRHGRGRFSIIDDTKRLAIVDDINEAREEAKESKHPYLSDDKLRKLDESHNGKKYAYFYKQTVAIWDGREDKGAFPIERIPISRGLCSSGIFLMCRDKDGHIIRTERYTTGFSKKAKRNHAIRKRRYLAALRREVLRNYISKSSAKTRRQEQASKKKSKPKMIRASRVKRGLGRSNTKISKYLQEVKRDEKRARQFIASDLHTPIGG